MESSLSKNLTHDELLVFPNRAGVPGVCDLREQLCADHRQRPDQAISV
jgi:hypothetical protein